jgi:hypothetical protein
MGEGALVRTQNSPGAPSWNEGRLGVGPKI